MSSGRRIVVVAAVGALGFCGVLGAVAVIANERDSVTVSEVAMLAQQEPSMPAAKATLRTVDGIGFPNWDRWGWHPVGGRTDRDDGRVVATVLYRKADDRIAYSIVSGTEDVNSDRGARSFTRTPPGGKVGLDVSGVDQSLSMEVPGDCDSGECKIGSGVATTVKRKINERSVILTAWGPSDELAEAAQDMALRTKR